MSKLRSDELVNMEGDGAPSFPQGATSIEPTADNQVATKLYVDSALSAASGNAVSATAPINPAVGSFWTDTSVSPSILKTWNGSMWIEFAGTAAAAVGVVVSLPSLSATNLEHAPATITASAAQVSNATLFITKWYKDDVEIVGATGSTYVATEPGVYRYEERWADNAGNVLTPSLNKTIELLAIEAPSITIPVAGTGLSDFDYTAESSAITNVGQVTSDVPSVGSPTVFESDSTDIISSVYDSANQKVVIAYRDQGDNNCRVVVGTVSGTNISFVSSVIFDSQLNDISAAYDSNSNKIVIAYRDGQNDSYGTAIVGTVSGTSISFGSPVVYDSTYCSETSVVYDSTNQKVVIAYKDAYNQGRGTAIVGTVSGTSISFGSDTVFNSSGDTRDISATFDSTNGKVVISYCDYGNNYYGAAIVGTVSGTSISFGSEVVFESATATNISSVYDPTNGKVVIAYRDSDNSGYGTAIVGTVSGTSISFGSPVVFNPTYTVFTSTVFDSANNKAIIAYRNVGNDGHGTAIAGTVSGTSISFDTASTFSFSSSSFISAVYDPNSNKVVAAFQNGGNNDYGTATVFSLASTATQLTLTDTTVSKVSDGSLVGGSTIDQVLTVGETVQADVSISTTVATPVFSATTYTGNGSTQTIDTGIDLDAGGGLIWIKKRGSQNHCLQDTEQGLENFAASNASGGFTSSTTRVTGATSTGYTIGNDSDVNESTRDYASWSFREAPAFFDVVTYTGDYTYPASYAVPHSLGSVPGMIIIRNTYHSGAWQVWHKGLSSTTGKALSLHATAAEDTHSGFFPTAPDADNFYLGDNSNINSQNQSYVAYVFADTPGVIKCGTYTGTGSSQTIDTGFKPKFVLTKSRSHSSDWYLMDSENPGQALYTNSSNGQQNVPIGYVNNGFTVDGRNFALNEIGYEYIYMAIAEDAEVDITSDIYASGTVSASSGNTITLSDTSGTWSTGMKVQGVTTDTKDYPDPIDASAVTFASSQPVVTSGTVNTWDYAEWNLSYDEQFSSVVHEKAVPLTATGTQAGPDSFPIQAGTEYFVRTKYASSLPSGQSDWSAVTRFLTKPNVYVDDVFSTDLYTSDGNPQTVNNGIDLAGEGGMLWIKGRTNTFNNTIVDSERGGDNGYGVDTLFVIESNRNAAQQTGVQPTTFTNTGYQTTYSASNGEDFASWTFRKAPGFFDVVTWTGTNDGTRIPHNLGSLPGMIMVKNLDSSEDWRVYAKKEMWIDNAQYAYHTLQLNTTSANIGDVANIANADTFNPQSMSSEASGTRYVAYLFADNDARFGTNSDEAIIKCGSYTTNSSGVIPDINLGFEPQWLLIKKVSGQYGSTGNWYLYDSMRGMPVGSNNENLYPNLANAAVTGANAVELTSTGFTSGPDYLASGTDTFIYMAIRRPHKPATVATDVFDVGLRSGSSSDTNTNSSILTDMTFVLRRDSSSEYNGLSTRLLGNHTLMLDNDSSGTTGWLDNSKSWATMNGAIINGGNGAANTGNLVDYSFKRAPGFFDVVTYTGTGSAQQVNHNLGVTPELMIVKQRDVNRNWAVYVGSISNPSTSLLFLNGNNSAYTGVTQHWGATDPTSTVFTVANDNDVNQIGGLYSAYLFASDDGISKVGSYTGTGGNIDVDCGFTNGARFILIKRTDSTGDWYVWDTERGIVSGNDPYMILNERDAEVNGTDYIDPFNAGFIVTSSAPAAINASGGEYIFLAIA